MPQRPLERQLHLYVAELRDGEVQLLDGGVTFFRVVVRHQVGEAEARRLPRVGSVPPPVEEAATW